VFHVDDIHSLSQFQRDTKAFIKRLKKTGQPAVLTVNGRAQVVVQDAAAYQELLGKLDRAEMTAAVLEALESLGSDPGRPVEEVMEEIRRRHKLPPPA